jgi:hypothetical protein
MPFRFWAHPPLRGVGLSAPIPQPPCGRLAGFPLQSLARLTASWFCQTAAISVWRGIRRDRHCEPDRAKQSSAMDVSRQDCSLVDAFLHMNISPSMPPTSQAELSSAMMTVTKPPRCDGCRVGNARHPGRLLPPPLAGEIAEEWFCAVLPLAGGVPQG